MQSLVKRLPKIAVEAIHEQARPLTKNRQAYERRTFGGSMNTTDKSFNSPRSPRWMTTRLPHLLLALALFAGGSHAVFAQFGASLSGTVTDTSGGIINNATATLTNEGTQQTLTRTSSSTGVFQFPSLPGGRYDLTVSSAGFKPSSFTAIDISQDSPRNFDVKLSAGGATETVDVSAQDTVALQTSDGSVGTVLDNQQFEKIPTYGRDPYNLARTAPGITGDGARSGNGSAVFLPNSVGPGGSNFGVAATENTVQIAASGQRITDNNFLVDGVSVNSLGYGGATVINPNIEAIASMQVVSTSFSAEDGRNSGAQIKIVTNSGTNQVHGSAFFQYDEPGLNAYNKYGGPAGQGALPTRVSTKARDYAASLGGPLLRDKLFAFASFEGISQNLRSFQNSFIETPQYRAAIHAQFPGSVGDRIVNAPGGVPVIRNVLTQSCTNPVDQTGGPGSPLCQVVNGGLDVGSPIGGPLGTYASFAKKNQIQVGGGLDGIPDIQFVQLDASQRSTARQYNGRMDYYLSPRDQLAGTAYVTKLYRVSPSDNARPNQALPFDPTNIATTFIYIHTFAPSLLNEFRSNYTLFAENGVYDAQQAGVNLGIPFIELQNSNYTRNNRIHFGANAGTTSPGIFAENQYEIRDTLTKTFGSHTLKIGFEGRLEQNNNNLVGGARPTYTFAGLWNFFNDAPIYEGVSADPKTGGQPYVGRHLDDHYYSAFVQHDWKATQQLTLNTGLRWEYFEPLYNKGLDINYPILGKTPGRELIDATLQPRHHLWNPNYKDFSPKVGFAYAPARFNSKSVLRGGFAVAYNRLDDVLFDPALENGPGVFSYGICCGVFKDDFGPGSGPLVNGQIQYGLGTSTAYNSFPGNPALLTPIGANGLPSNGIAIEAYGALPNLPNPYSYLYSLELQNELSRGFVVGIGYQGSTGRHYSRLVNQNFISSRNYPKGVSTFDNGLYLAHNDSNIYYNGLNVHVSKRYTAGLSLDGTYTYSKQMDQVTSGDGADGSANQTTPGNNALELGPGDFDTRHRVVASATYNFALYHGDSFFLRSALNGWQLNGIFTAHTGFPFTPTTYAISGLPLTPTSQTIGPIRPNSYVGSNSPTCSNDAFRNGTAFNGTFGVVDDKHGNAPALGRNSFRGPCYQDLDLGVAKEIKVPQLGERALARFQLQAFNVNNKLNFTPFGFSTSATRVDGSLDATGKFSPMLNGSPTSFGRPISATAGRVVELNARINF